MNLLDFCYQIQQEYNWDLPGGKYKTTLLLSLIYKLFNTHAREEF